MKLKLKDGTTLDVKFWSFTKCFILSNLVITGISYLLFFGVLIILWGFGLFK